MVTTFAGGVYPGGNCSFSVEHRVNILSQRFGVEGCRVAGWDFTKKELHRGFRRNASLHIAEDHDERHGLARCEGLSEPREAELGVRRVGGADASGPAFGGCVDADGVFRPLSKRLVEYRLVEGNWVAEEGILTAVLT